MSAYYNEFDPKAAAWLRELIKAGHIAPGEVDERSINEIIPTDLSGFTQHHFFAGIGVWSHSLRKAGWDDERPVWTGSCPCQPFSAAGKGEGFADERHLWPAFHWLIGQQRPEWVFGEQVAGGDGAVWLDLVLSDLEAAGYTCGAAVTGACGFGAPHIRKRSYWVAHSPCSGRSLEDLEGGGPGDSKEGPSRGYESNGTSGGMVNPEGAGHSGRDAGKGCGEAKNIEGRVFIPDGRSTPGGVADSDTERQLRSTITGEVGSEEGQEGPGGDKSPAASGHHGADGGMADSQCDRQWKGGGSGGEGTARDESRPQSSGCSEAGGVEHSTGVRREGCVPNGEKTRSDPGDTIKRAESPGGMADSQFVRREDESEPTGDGGAEDGLREADRPGVYGPPDGAGPTNGLWAATDWLFCRDGKWRPVESGSFPLVNGTPARVGRLRGYGNALTTAQAIEFIRATMKADAS